MRNSAHFLISVPGPRVFGTFRGYRILAVKLCTYRNLKNLPKVGRMNGRRTKLNHLVQLQPVRVVSRL